MEDLAFPSFGGFYPTPYMIVIPRAFFWGGLPIFVQAISTKHPQKVRNTLIKITYKKLRTDSLNHFIKIDWFVQKDWLQTFVKSTIGNSYMIIVDSSMRTRAVLTKVIAQISFTGSHKGDEKVYWRIIEYLRRSLPSHRMLQNVISKNHEIKE